MFSLFAKNLIIIWFYVHFLIICLCRSHQESPWISGPEIKNICNFGSLWFDARTGKKTGFITGWLVSGNVTAGSLETGTSRSVMNIWHIYSKIHFPNANIHFQLKFASASEAIRSRHHVQTQGYPINWNTVVLRPKIQRVTSEQVENLSEKN